MIREMIVVASMLVPCVVMAAEPTTAPSAATVKFSDGSSVEIVAIADDGQTPPKAWASDGTELPAPPWAKRESKGPRGMGTPIREGMRTLRILARVTLADPSSNPRVMISPVMPKGERPRNEGGGAAVGEQRSGGRGPAMNAGNVANGADGAQKIDVIGPFPADLQEITLNVSVAGGKWRDIERHDIGQPPPQGAKLKVGKIEQQGGETSVEIDGVPLRMMFGNSQLAAILADGNEAKPMGMKVMNGVSSYRFVAAGKEITAIVLRERGSESAEVRGVALQPGVKTTPTAAAPTTKPADTRPF